MNNNCSLIALDAPPPQLSADSNDPQKFIYWKKRFEVYVKSKSLRLWRIIEFGDYVPHKVSPDGNGTIVKPKSEWSVEDEAKVCENYLAIRLLYSILPDEDFKIIFFCNTAHDIWRTLGILHKGKDQITKDAAIDDLTQQFETFEIQPYDEMNSVYVRFKRIIDCLKALGKTYSNETCVERFLSALPSVWKFKVRAIRENKNLAFFDIFG